MRVRYFIEYKLLQDTDGHHFYQPIGVWARGEGPWELTDQYVPEFEERQWDADIWICDFMEQGDDHLPDDVLERWINSISSYDGDCSSIYIADADNSEMVARQLLDKIINGKALSDPPYT